MLRKASEGNFSMSRRASHLDWWNQDFQWNQWILPARFLVCLYATHLKYVIPNSIDDIENLTIFRLTFPSFWVLNFPTFLVARPPRGIGFRIPQWNKAPRPWIRQGTRKIAIPRSTHKVLQGTGEPETKDDRHPLSNEKRGTSTVDLQACQRLIRTSHAFFGFRFWRQSSHHVLIPYHIKSTIAHHDWSHTWSCNLLTSKLYQCATACGIRRPCAGLLDQPRRHCLGGEEEREAEWPKW